MGVDINTQDKIHYFSSNSFEEVDINIFVPTSMGLSTIDPYKKMTVSSECFDIEQLAIQQKLLRLQLEMIENELKQAEIFKSLQSSRQTILSCSVADTSDSDSLEAAIVTLS